MLWLVNMMVRKACKDTSMLQSWYTLLRKAPDRECRCPPCVVYFKLLDACPVRMEVRT